MSDRKMKVGDLAPDLRVLVTSKEAEFDVESIVSANVTVARDNTLLFTRAATTLTPVHAGVIVAMPFQAGDTDTPGDFDVEIELIWPGGKPQTIRTDNRLRIRSDLP